MTEPADGTETAEDTKAPPPSTGDKSADTPRAKRDWMATDSRSRRIILGLVIYLVCLVVFAIMAGDRLGSHTHANHYALLADAWLHGRHDLGGTPPGYTGMDDFALFQSKWFISFPPFPAMLMVPFVWLSGSAENFRDGQFIVWLAGIGPAVLFLVFEKLRRTGRSERTETDNLRLALLFAFGTVYFFTAVQGTVWYAAHVVGVALMALFVLFALDAERPVLAGAMVGCLFLTRTTTILVSVFFAFELARVAYAARTDESGAPRALPSEGPLLDRIEATWDGVDRRVALRLFVSFCLPILAALALASWMNNARFGNPAPWAFGHEYLQIGWRTRIDRWGLFSFHVLPRNLSVMLASLPWKPVPSEPKVPLQLLGMTFQVPRYMISGHGLALWWTTPMYLWLVRPKNSGWFTFGYRFSNDYAVLLFVLVALAAPRFTRAFWIAAIWAVLWNTFGAASFLRPKYDAFYSHEAALSTRRYGGPATLDLVFPPD
jgi:hypothetical protein